MVMLNPQMRGVDADGRRAVQLQPSEKFNGTCRSATPAAGLRARRHVTVLLVLQILIKKVRQ